MTSKVASVIGLSAILTLASGGIKGASAQSAKALEGTWTLKSADDVGAGGARKPLYGTGATGILIFLPDGAYALQIHAAGVPKFASGDRLKATPEEYKAVVLDALRRLLLASRREFQLSRVVPQRPCPCDEGREQGLGWVRIAGVDPKVVEGWICRNEPAVIARVLENPIVSLQGKNPKDAIAHAQLRVRSTICDLGRAANGFQFT
jgi:hypothetical protein